MIVLLGRFIFAASIVFAVAAQADPATDAAKSPALMMLTSKNYAVKNSFDAGHGLIGWVVERAGQSSVVYTTSDGQLLLVGALVDEKGNNLTESYTQKYAANPAIGAAYDALGSTNFIAIKPSGPTREIVYIVFDPNCPFCSVAYKSLKQYSALGIEFRWVPVAYLRADSANRIAAILTAPNPADALQANEENYNERLHEGAVRPASSVAPALVSQLQANDAIMHSVGSTSTPTFFWKDSSGHARDFAGLPPPETMAQIVGIQMPH